MTDLLQPARIAAQMAADLAGAAVAGTLLSALWLGRSLDAEAATKLRRCFLLASALQLASLLATLLLIAAIMSDAPTWAAVRAALPDVLSTEAGHTLALTCCGAAPLLALALVPSMLRKPALRLTALALTGLLAALRTPLGHASVDGPWSLREAVQLIHLISIQVWGGGVLIAGLFTVPALLMEGRADAALAFAQRLSRTVTIALPLVLVSGLYNSWRGIGSAIAAVPRSTWGQLLVAKIVVVLIALALGARMHRMLRRPATTRPSPDANARFLRASLRIEAIAMLAILLLSAWLANAPPPNMG